MEYGVIDSSEKQRRNRNFGKLSRISGLGFLLVGVYLLVNGLIFQSDNENIPDAFNIYWMATAAAFIVGILGAVFKNGIVYSTTFSRIIVGSLFVVSGIIKANDPLGFSFKLEEYFEPTALGWTYFLDHGWALPLSVIISGFEIVLGLAVLLGGMIRISAWALLGMILFFAWLTYYTADCNDAMAAAMSAGTSFDRQCVLDCGCFGDALKGSIGRSLTPWESFFKDLVLLILVIPIVLMQKHIKFNKPEDDRIILPGAMIFAFIMGVVLFDWWLPLLFILLVFAVHFGVRFWLKNDKKQEWALAGVSLVFSFAFTLYTFTYLPVKDYRPYAVGNDLRVKMSDGVAGKYEDTFIYKHKTTGAIKEYSLADVTADWDTVKLEYKTLGEYDFVDKKSVVVSEGNPASISDFRPHKLYQNLLEKETLDTAIQRNVAEQYADYYEKVHVLENVQYDYVDSVLEMDYDPSYYPLSDTTWGYLGLVEKKLQESDMEVDFTNFLLNSNRCLLFISYDLTRSYPGDKEGEMDTELRNPDQWKQLMPLMSEAENEGLDVFVLTSATQEWIDKLEELVGRELNVLLNDGTELKIIIRSNPGVVYLEKGVVKGKWDYNRIPTLVDLK